MAMQGKPVIAKSTIEEFANSATKSTQRRIYNVRDIKIEPLENIGFTNDSLARSFSKSSDISISDLYSFVNIKEKLPKQVTFAQKGLALKLSDSVISIADLYSFVNIKEKSQEMFRVLRLKLPKGVNNFLTKIIIHHYASFVNTA